MIQATKTDIFEEDSKADVRVIGKRKESTTRSESRNITDDPIRMYLMQMGEIPLLSREEELAYAKEIEATPESFSPLLLSAWYECKECWGRHEAAGHTLPTLLFGTLHYMYDSHTNANNEPGGLHSFTQHSRRSFLRERQLAASAA